MKDGGIQIQGHESFTYRTTGAIGTRDSDFLEHDFTFEVQFEFHPDDYCVYIGIGLGQPDISYNGLTDSVYVKFHSLESRSGGEGAVDVKGFKLGNDNLGKVTVGGTHAVRIIKEGKAVTFYVDPASDGPSDDDLELTINDIKQYAPFFNSKNMHIFFGGGGIYKNATLSKGRAIYPATPKSDSDDSSNEDGGAANDSKTQTSATRGTGSSNSDDANSAELPFSLTKPLMAKNYRVIWAVWGDPFQQKLVDVALN